MGVRNGESKGCKSLCYRPCARANSSFYNMKQLVDSLLLDGDASPSKVPSSNQWLTGVCAKRICEAILRKEGGIIIQKLYA